MRGSEIQSIDYSRTEPTSFVKTAVGSLNVVVVGAGALGNEVVKALGLLGCGHVLIIDHDVVERHNLTRSVLLRTEEAIGRNKALSLEAACRHYFPGTMWTAIDAEIVNVGSERIAESDIVFSCVDSELARLEIAYLGTKFDRPVCDAGLGGENYSTARVSFFPGRRAASFCCMLPPARRRELLTMWDCPSFPCWGDPRAEVAWPGTPTAAAIAGSLQVDVGLRLLLEFADDIEPCAQSVELALGSAPRLTSFRVPVSPGCPFHEDMPRNTVLQPGDSSVTLGGLLDLAARGRPGEPALVLDWPLCVSAKCRACGCIWLPMKRLAVFRRSGACPACLSKEVVPSRTIHRLGRDSDLAARKLHELGMPDRHLYTIEFQPGPAQ